MADVAVRSPRVWPILRLVRVHTLRLNAGCNLKMTCFATVFFRPMRSTGTIIVLGTQLNVLQEKTQKNKLYVQRSFIFYVLISITNVSAQKKRKRIYLIETVFVQIYENKSLLRYITAGVPKTVGIGSDPVLYLHQDVKKRHNISMLYLPMTRPL